MDDALKQRLIGAILVVGTAVIVLASLLGGHVRKKPDSQSSAKPSRVAHDTAPANTTPRLKAQTTSPQPMSQPQVKKPGKQSHRTGTTVQSPGNSKPRQTAKAAHAQPTSGNKPTQQAQIPAQASQPHSTTPGDIAQGNPPAQQTSSAPVKAKPEPAKPNTTQPEPRKTAKSPAPATSTQPPSGHTGTAPQNRSGWVVQVASFRKRQQAEDMKNHLSKQGFQAFIASGSVSGHTVYRVRVGPVATKAARDKLAHRLRGRLGHNVLPLRQ